MGVSADGARCVQAPMNGLDALFVVGGSTNASTQDYPGLQVYTFADKTWRNWSPQISVTRNRLMHGAAYLQSTSSILIYAGFQDNSYLSTSATFTISTNDPNFVRSFSSDAPSVIQPILLPWNSSHAVLLGGNTENREVWVFSEADGWNHLDVKLPNGLQDISRVQAALLNREDGSKILEIFDEGASPNTVTTLLLRGPDGQPAASQGSSSSTSSSPPAAERRRSRPGSRRDIQASTLPAYNSTFAPLVTRNGFSLAQDPSGLVVITGGNNQVPISLFNQTENGWLDAVQFFNTPPTAVSAPNPTTASPTESLTAIPSSSSSSPPLPDPNAGRNNSLLIVGATLGGVFGFAAILLAVLLLLRYLKQRQKTARKQRAGELPLESKHRMDFADQGAEFMSSAGGSFGRSNHRASNSGQTATSTFLTKGSNRTKRGFFHKAGDSNGSTKSLFSRDKSPIISSPHPFTSPRPDRPLLAVSPVRLDGLTLGVPSPEPRTEPRTDEGWSRYFANNNNATDLSNMPSGYTRYDHHSTPSTYTSSSHSNYTSSRIPSSHPHQSAEVAPLNLGANQCPSSEHRHGDPTHLCPFPHIGASHSHTRQLVPSTPSTLFTHLPDDDDLDESSGHESWTPVGTSDRGSTWGDRPASSAYGESVAYAHPGEKVRIPNFPGVPSSRASQKTVIHRGEERGMRRTASKDFVGGLPRPSERPKLDGGSRQPGFSDEDQRSIPFPRRVHDTGGLQRVERSAEDMSWLNLGK
ncbi:MAG: hypothetical protein Q9187_006082 [Circinaria calcarea]